MSPDAALAVARFVNATAGLVLWGGCGYLAALVPAGLAATLGRRLRPVIISAGAAAVLSAAALPLITTAMIGDGWASALSPALVGAVSFGTTIGQSLLARLAAALLLLPALAVNGRVRLGLLAGAGGLMLITSAFSGHGVLPSGPLGDLHQLNHMVHLLAAGGWFGALVPVLVLLRALKRAGDHSPAIRALTAFSRYGQGAVALTLLSGVVNSLLILTPWPVAPAPAPSTNYLLLLGVKILLALIMAALALWNRLISLPQLKQAPSRTLRALAWGVGGQILLGLATIALVAVFGLLAPTAEE